MKNIAWLVVAGFAIGAVACGDSSSTTTTGGGGSGGESAGGSNAGGDNTGGTTNGPNGPGPGGGGAPSCSGGALDPACDECLLASCCGEYGACEADSICIDCITGSEDPACADNAAAADLVGCAQASCDAECFGGGPAAESDCEAPAVSPSAGSCVDAASPCNPVTNAGCDAAAGEACDFGADGFECYPAPNTLMLCEDCTAGDNFCSGGMTCGGATCAKFCCDDGDCSAGGTCDLEAGGGTVGICIVAAP